MALAPKPITLTSVTKAAYEGSGDPQPFVVVDNGAAAGEAGLVTTQPAIANQANAGTLADLTAAQTAINSVTAKVNAILVALRAAGVIAP